MKLYVIKKTLDFASYLNRLIVVFLLKYEYFKVSFFKGLHKTTLFSFFGFSTPTLLTIANLSVSENRSNPQPQGINLENHSKIAEHSMDGKEYASLTKTQAKHFLIQQDQFKKISSRFLLIGNATHDLLTSSYLLRFVIGALPKCLPACRTRIRMCTCSTSQEDIFDLRDQ